MSEKEEVIYSIYHELKGLRIMFEMFLCFQFNEVLNKIAKTDNRKVIWVLLDGKLSTSQISERLEISTRAVQQFIEELISRNLAVRIKKGFYKRSINCIPQEWYKIKKVKELVVKD